MRTAVAIGTGPSLTFQQIQIAREKGFDLAGCNNVYAIVDDLKVLYACNAAWWDTYWDGYAEMPPVKDHKAEKWTTNLNAAKRYKLNWIQERFGMGLSQEPGIIHHGHGSGYSLIGVLHKLGYERILLVGYDLKYAPDYDGRARNVGSVERHYFGEYPRHLQHWPSKCVVNGVHVELVELYRSIHDQGILEIINCSPDSALIGVIPSCDISEVEESKVA